MASVALLHDFAPYGFHGAIGPERLILAGEGRIVVAEHVLGTLVEEAAAAWGVDPALARFPGGGAAGADSAALRPAGGRRAGRPHHAGDAAGPPARRGGLPAWPAAPARSGRGDDARGHPGAAPLAPARLARTDAGAPRRFVVPDAPRGPEVLRPAAPGRGLRRVVGGLGGVRRRVRDRGLAGAGGRRAAGPASLWWRPRSHVRPARASRRVSPACQRRREPAGDFGLPGLPEALPLSATTATTVSAEPCGQRRCGGTAEGRPLRPVAGRDPYRERGDAAGGVRGAGRAAVGGRRPGGGAGHDSAGRRQPPCRRRCGRHRRLRRPRRCRNPDRRRCSKRRRRRPSPRLHRRRSTPSRGPGRNRRRRRRPRSPTGATGPAAGTCRSSRGHRGSAGTDFEADEFAEQEEDRAAVRTRRIRLAVLVGLALLAATAAAFRALCVEGRVRRTPGLRHAHRGQRARRGHHQRGRPGARPHARGAVAQGRGAPAGGADRRVREVQDHHGQGERERSPRR